MKMTKIMLKVQGNMQPGVITEEGFLGDENIPIIDMINRDEGEMIKTGLSFEETAERLLFLLLEGQKGLGEPVTIEDKWLIRTIDPRGKLPCPFEDFLFPKMTAEITRKSTGETLIVTNLSIHLMAEHHFLEGIGSQFRMEPKKLKRILFD
ncbi:MAG: hypothetical protein PF518_10105 [Spirochaetaceae bacterium]|jgi:hypothetical protein|nr:hypothetical protein [Spirochaetaceae bacterium]